MRAYCKNVIPVLGNDKPLPEIRTWSDWSHDHRPGFIDVPYPPSQCQDGQFITGISWHEFADGFCDVKIKCSGSSEWKGKVTGCEDWHNHVSDHFWTEVCSINHYQFSLIDGALLHKCPQNI